MRSQMKMIIVSIARVNAAPPDVIPVVVAAMDSVARQAFCAGLLLDLPSAVVVQHDLRFDDTGGGVRRVVVDPTGVIYDDDHRLGHACLACAVREDLVPTIATLASDGRWRSIVVALPVSGDPQAVVGALTRAAALGELGPAQVACVAALVDAEAAREDLFGDDLLVERGLAFGGLDRRSVGEALARQLECADVVGLGGPADATTYALIRRIAQSAERVQSWTEIVAGALTARRLDWPTASRRTDVLAVQGSRLPDADGVWTLDLQASRPFHPGRLLARIDELGVGRLRARGHFWLASRPGQVCVWDGAGGQLSIGPYGRWDERSPSTRLVFVGDDHADRDRVAIAFDQLLATPAELGRWAGGRSQDDGFGPWLDSAEPWAA